MYFNLEHIFTHLYEVIYQESVKVSQNLTLYYTSSFTDLRVITSARHFSVKRDTTEIIRIVHVMHIKLYESVRLNYYKFGKNQHLRSRYFRMETRKHPVGASSWKTPPNVVWWSECYWMPLLDLNHQEEMLSIQVKRRHTNNDNTF